MFPYDAVDGLDRVCILYLVAYVRALLGPDNPVATRYGPCPDSVTLRRVAR
jgi:hypothetical protein